MVPFANQLRSQMTASTAITGNKYYLAAAPQCPYPDAADGAMLAGAVYFDLVWVQFYNNYCGLPSFNVGSTTQYNFNFDTWDNWAKTVSLNRNVKIILGIPAAPGGGSGYESGSKLASIIAYCKGFSSFGGVMMWDMSQLYSNLPFLDEVASDLGPLAIGGGGGGATTSATTTKTTATTTATTTVTTMTSPGGGGASTNGTSTSLTAVIDTTTTTSVAKTEETSPPTGGMGNQWSQVKINRKGGRFMLT
jgi:chitinase